MLRQRAVEAALKHPKHQAEGIRGVARHCGVSEGYVHKMWHPSVHGEQMNDDGTRTVTRQGQTFTMQTAKIGKKRKPQKSTVEIDPTPEAPAVEPDSAANWLPRYGKLTHGRT